MTIQAAQTAAGPAFLFSRQTLSGLAADHVVGIFKYLPGRVIDDMVTEW